MAKKTKKMSGMRREIDPVVTDIVRNGVIAVTEEMKTNLMRTAYNIIIYEALDFTTGLFTPQGETISIGIGLPMFIRGMAETVKAKIAHFGIKHIRPGDIYVTNDSYLTGSHLNHVTLTLPIFHKGKLTAFSCCMAHWLDIGGTLGGMTTDIYSEGLQLPILKYQDRGVVNQAVVDIIKQNVRLPSRAMGDLRAQVTAVKTGERRFLQLLDRYGRDAVLDAIAAIMDHAEAMARSRTRTIPDGVYEAESFMDDDGIDIGRKVPIRVKVVVKGDEMTVDLSDVSKQVRGFYNSGVTTGHACAGRLQVHHLADRLSDQRRIVPQSQDHCAAGAGHQRGAAGADALVDDLSDDHRRHHLQGAGAGDTRSRHRRPPCRSPGIVVPRHQQPHLGVLHRQLWAARRRLGCQADRGRRFRHGLHQ